MICKRKNQVEFEHLMKLSENLQKLTEKSVLKAFFHIISRILRDYELKGVFLDFLKFTLNSEKKC